jgi:PAS domain S-box-containing protein
MLSSIARPFQPLLTVRATDPEDARRRKLLNILLVGVMLITLIALASIILTTFLGIAGEPWEVMLLFMMAVGALVGVAIIFVINRYRSGWFASALFLLLLTAVITFGDDAREVVAGRSLFMFAIPIIMASVLIRPYASFILAGLTAILISAIAISINIVPNTPAILSFMILALVSWLSARSLEHALNDLRAINRELDQRVAQRTQDLSEALSREQAESSKNQAILESIADGVIVFDNRGRAIVANPSIAHLMGRSPNEIMHSDIQALMAKDVDEADREMTIRLLQDESLRTPSFKFRWREKTLSVSFATVRSASSVIGTVMVCRDFTREAELDRMKSAFLSMTSHELRTPLNAILGYSDMLQEEVYGPLTTEQSRTISRITANTSRMLGMVNNLLDQAQIEAGKLAIHIEPFAVEKLIDDLRSAATVLAENKGLELTCSVEPGVPSTLASDAQRLHQILLNLVGNAVKFTQKGAVGVRVFRPDADHWALEVSDTGAGIPLEAQSYIFEPFRQVDDPTTRNNVGSGLGLSIVKQLTHLLGGDIHLKSHVGQGSTFTVILPLKPIQELETA